MGEESKEDEEKSACEVIDDAAIARKEESILIGYVAMKFEKLHIWRDIYRCIMSIYRLTVGIRRYIIISKLLVLSRHGNIMTLTIAKLSLEVGD